MYAQANEYHISYKLLYRIAYCESGVNPTAQNPHSSASGIFQWLDSSFFRYAQAYDEPLIKDDPYVQTELAVKVIANGGLSNWNASKSCWGKLVN